MQLHPLVLLTISDYITRHISRQQLGPIVGSILGRQHGRSLTLEHAYECKTGEGDGGVVLDREWFDERLEQYKDVHKAPALDLVGIFMLGPTQGPSDFHLRFVKEVQKLTSTDSVMLLLFHPEQVDQLQGGKLPITLYESVKEQEGGDVETKFRELGFEVETGDAEMIGVDFVATGAGVASAVPRADSNTATSAAESSSKEKKTKGKGKAKETDGGANGAAAAGILSPEDEELIASLTAKSNAIKMLHQRLSLIRSYLNSQPSSYLTDATSKQPAPDSTNHTLLRSINAMLSRLPLLASPSASSAAGLSPATAADKEKEDVHLTSLLSALTRSISETQVLSSKFNIVAREKAVKERSPFAGSGGGMNKGGGRLGFGEDGLLSGGDSGGY